MSAAGEGIEYGAKNAPKLFKWLWNVARGGGDEAGEALLKNYGDDAARIAAQKVAGSGARGVTTATVPRYFTAREISRMGRSLKYNPPALSAIGKNAGESMFSQIGRAIGKGGSARKVGKFGVGLLALETLVRPFGVSPIGGIWKNLTGGESEPKFDVSQALTMIPQAPAPLSQEEQFKQWQAENPFQPTLTPDVVGGVNAAAGTQRDSLNNYLAATGEYSKNQAQAISDAYKQMSQALLRDSGDVFQRGQVTAADIDQLYEQLAAENLGTAYGEGLSTPTSDLAGLAAPSGEAATAPDTTRTYGSTLANYLGQQAGIESSALEQTAASQALQGAALAQSLRDYVTMAEQEKRYQLESQIAAQLAEAARQQEMLKYESEREAQDYARQVAQQEFGFRNLDRQEAALREQERRDAANLAVSLWISATSERRKLYEQIGGGQKGQAGMNAFVQEVYKNPEILSALGEYGGRA